MITKLKKLGDKHATNINENEGRHRCKNCFSTGFNPTDLSFYEACFTCGGHGHLTWVDNIIKSRRKDVNEQTVETCSLNNIIQALTVLKRNLRLLDVGSVSVKLDFDSKDEEKQDKINELRELIDLYIYAL